MNAALRIFPVVLLAFLAQDVLAQQAFPSPDAAAEALVAALGTKQADPVRLAALLGADWRAYIPLAGVDRDDVDAFLARYREKHSTQPDGQGQVHLVVGTDPWTLPLPIMQGKDGWAFNAKAGGEEIRERRIGRNELATVQSALAYYDAQVDYAEVDRDGDGVLEYAQKFISSNGKYDGLYWAEEPGIEESPLGPLFGDAKPDGDWHGYHYRILDAQGPSAPGGAYNYKLGDNMSRGFALIAWPVKYGDSGVMSFMISHEGQVFEKDQGPDSAKLATAMHRFDPDSSWSDVEEQPVP
ncbi:DUF2950 domain-containing protein [Pseudomonas fluorescens]|uniref:DUF2950 domain-containing protein n=1 Tax=Pseudomonas fluorescens TaxID=294 RepID=A0A5E7A5L9_PSEFL|nr:DUF2950 domain-containing protein [Pseudomonas fluorescens]VVN70933.1 hypothetical protein PS723_00399 [Pseudomonas fluorescens]